MAAQTVPIHGAHDDLLAMLTGSLLAALGIVFFNEAGLFAGGTVELALPLNDALPFRQQPV